MQTKERGWREKSGAGGGASTSLVRTFSCFIDAVSCVTRHVTTGATFVQCNQLNKQKQHNLGGFLLKKLEKIKTCQVSSEGLV